MGAVTLGSKAAGSTIKLEEGGSLVDFYVAKQDYESALNGTGRVLVARKDGYEQRQWHSSNINAYASSDIDRWLNGNYKNLLSSDIRTAIGSTKIYYTIGNGNTSKAVLQRGVFLLSAAELGKQESSFNTEGAVLPTADMLKIVRLNGSAVSQWTRTADVTGSRCAVPLNRNGDFSSTADCISTHGIRPAFTLPSSLFVNDDGSVFINTAPTIPSALSIPNSIQGGTTITVSWGASTDAENNLEGYIVQRSTDGGSSWNQIYQGSGRSTTNTVAFGTTSVMYRVKAYDTEGLQSGWRTSSQITVNNNTAPTAPASITVPDVANGGQALTISWGASTDKEGNLAGYKLERQVNGGSWSEIYEGSDTFYTDTIVKGWNSVGYRVRAYDTLGAASEYVTGTTRTVNNNTAPTISGQDASLGLKTGGFSQTYTVSDAEGDSVTVTEYVDSTQIRSYTAALGQQATVTLTREMWLTLTNGTHQLRVEATDGKATTARIWTFSKKETVICFRLVAPEETDTAAAKIIVSPTWQIAGATAKVEACNNAFDTNPAWEDITAMIALNRVYNFINKTKTASKWGIDFRFTITKNEGYDGEVSISGFGGAYE